MTDYFLEMIISAFEMITLICISVAQWDRNGMGEKKLHLNKYLAKENDSNKTLIDFGYLLRLNLRNGSFCTFFSNSFFKPHCVADLFLNDKTDMYLCIILLFVFQIVQ